MGAVSLAEIGKVMRKTAKKEDGWTKNSRDLKTVGYPYLLSRIKFFTNLELLEVKNG